MDVWKGKKVFVEIINSCRRYSGIVEEESSDKILLRDIKDKLVEIPKQGSLIQEEL